MAIPSKQIGQSNEANLLWYIAKELEQIKGLLANQTPSTTTSTTTISGPTNTVFKTNSTVEIVCNEPATLSLYYTGTLTEGTLLFTDAALTQSFTQSTYIADPVTGAVYATFQGAAAYYQFTCV